MALADTVTGDGKLTSISLESGSYEQTKTKILSNGEEVKKLITTYFTDVSREYTWYALTANAVLTYIEDHPMTYVEGDPTRWINTTMTNDKLQSWELTVGEKTRLITNVIIKNAPEPEPAP